MKVQGNLTVADTLEIDGTIKVGYSSQPNYFLGVDPNDSVNNKNLVLRQLPTNIGGPIFVTAVTAQSGGNVQATYAADGTVTSASTSNTNFTLSIEAERGDSTEYVPQVKIWGLRSTPNYTNGTLVATPTSELLQTGGITGGQGINFGMTAISPGSNIFTGVSNVIDLTANGATAGNYTCFVVSNGTIARRVNISTISAPVVISAGIVTSTLPGGAGGSYTGTLIFNSTPESFTVPWSGVQTSYKNSDVIQMQLTTNSDLLSITLNNSAGSLFSTAATTITSSGWTRSGSSPYTYTFSAPINSGTASSGQSLGFYVKVKDIVGTDSISLVQSSGNISGTQATIPYFQTYPSISVPPSGTAGINYGTYTALSGALLASSGTATVSFVVNSADSLTNQNIVFSSNQGISGLTLGAGSISNNAAPGNTTFQVLKAAPTSTNNIATNNFSIIVVNSTNRSANIYQGVIRVFENVNQVFSAYTGLTNFISGPGAGWTTTTSTSLQGPYLNSAPAMTISNLGAGMPANVISVSASSYTGTTKSALSFSVTVKDSIYYPLTYAARTFTISTSGAKTISGMDVSAAWQVYTGGFTARAVTYNASTTIDTTPLEIGTSVDVSNLNNADDNTAPLFVSFTNSSGKSAQISLTGTVNGTNYPAVGGSNGYFTLGGSGGTAGYHQIFFDGATTVTKLQPINPSYTGTMIVSQTI